MTQTTAIERFTQLIVNEAIERGRCPQCVDDLAYLVRCADGLIYCPGCDFEAQLPTDTAQREDAE